MSLAEQLAEKHHSAGSFVWYKDKVVKAINEALELAAQEASPHNPPCRHVCQLCSIAARIRKLKE